MQTLFSAVLKAFTSQLSSSHAASCMHECVCWRRTCWEPLPQCCLLFSVVLSWTLQSQSASLAVPWSLSASHMTRLDSFLQAGRKECALPADYQAWGPAIESAAKAGKDHWRGVSACYAFNSAALSCEWEITCKNVSSTLLITHTQGLQCLPAAAQFPVQLEYSMQVRSHYDMQTELLYHHGDSYGHCSSATYTMCISMSCPCQ